MKKVKQIKRQLAKWRTQVSNSMFKEANPSVQHTAQTAVVHWESALSLREGILAHRRSKR